MSDDDAWQHAVLSHVLRLYPEILSAAELRRAMTAAGEDPNACDDAVVALIGDGLLRRGGDGIVPTRAVLRYIALQ